VNEDHGRATIEFGIERLQARIAEIEAAAIGLQHDAIGAEFVERTDGLPDRGFDVGQWQTSEVAEAGGMRLPQPGAFVVAATRQIGRAGITTEMHAR
jgi:hypothetical protein